MGKCIAEYLGEHFDNSDISNLLEGNLTLDPDISKKRNN
jgi:hypothetical protein